MTGKWLKRVFRSRSQAFVVWAMMPLALLNGRTVIGCGCTGHFEAVCHCQCCTAQDSSDQKSGTAECACCGGHSSHSRSCCCQTKATNPCDSPDNNAPLNDREGLNAHHCTAMVVHVVVPAVQTISFLGDDVDHSATALMPIELPFSAPLAKVDHHVAFDTGPPPTDCVIVFRRLVI